MKLSAQFVRFCVVGTINTSVDGGVFLLLEHIGMSVFVANLISTSLGLCTSYALHTRYTFSQERYSSHQLVRFLIVTLSGLWLLQPLIIWMLQNLIGNSSFLAMAASKAGAIGLTLIWNYLWYRNHVFARQ